VQACPVIDQSITKLGVGRRAQTSSWALEPESDDGLVTWNIIDEGLGAGEAYPIYRVTNTTALRFK